MCLHRRRVVCALVASFVSAGCLGEDSQSLSFDLRIENRDSRRRELSVVVEHVTEAVIYDETRQLAAGEQIDEPMLVEDPGRYRIEASDTTADEERTAERHVELSTGDGFCGRFAVWTDDESVTVTVPRCPDEQTEPDPSASVLYK